MKTIIALLLVLFFSPAQARIKALATTPDISWLIERVGGNKVEVDSLLEGVEDPHYVDAMPHWIAKLSRIDVFCVMGLGLEIAWVEKIISRSGNHKIGPGGKGHCDAGRSVKALDVPSGKIDRSLGDVHPEGNPHYNLGPSFYLQAAREIEVVLSRVDPANALFYRQNLQQLKEHMEKIKREVQQKLSLVRKKKLMSYHREFTYFFHDFALPDYGEVEEIPGVPPSAGRMARVGLKAKETGIDMVLASNNNPQKILQRFSEISGAKVVQVAISIRKNGRPQTYRDLLLNIADALVKKAHQ